MTYNIDGFIDDDTLQLDARFRQRSAAERKLFRTPACASHESGDSLVTEAATEAEKKALAQLKSDVCWRAGEIDRRRSRQEVRRTLLTQTLTVHERV